jgi:hypothetical protein
MYFAESALVTPTRLACRKASGKMAKSSPINVLGTPQRKEAFNLLIRQNESHPISSSRFRT